MHDSLIFGHLAAGLNTGTLYIICLERVARYGSGRDNSVGAMNAELSRPDLLTTVQLVRKQA